MTGETISSAFRFARWRMLLATMFCYLFFYTGRHTIGFAFPGIEAEFGVSKAQLGWVEALFLWSYAVGQFVNGNLGDRFGGRRMMSLGAVLSCAINWIVSFSTGVRMLGVGWGVNGYFQSLAWAPGSRLLSNWWDRRHHGMVYGLYVFSAGLASTLAFATSLLVIDTLELDWRWIFRLPVLLMLIGGIVFYLVARDCPEDLGFKSPHDDADDNTPDTTANEGFWQRYGEVLKNWRVIATALLIGFQNAARYGLLTWVPVHFLGESYKTAGNAPINKAWITIALPIGMAFGALSNGMISDRFFSFASLGEHPAVYVIGRRHVLRHARRCESQLSYWHPAAVSGRIFCLRPGGFDLGPLSRFGGPSPRSNRHRRCQLRRLRRRRARWAVDRADDGSAQDALRKRDSGRNRLALGFGLDGG